jgi:hypothetical protein
MVTANLRLDRLLVLRARDGRVNVGVPKVMASVKLIVRAAAQSQVDGRPITADRKRRHVVQLDKPARTAASTILG